MELRFCDHGYTVGHLPKGPGNRLTDVPGVRVGHTTIHNARHHTGVTVILPREDVYRNKCIAACDVLNGYGKSAGLVQIEELGQLETPIALTNTLNVGLVYDALVQYTIDTCAAAGRTVRSVNPVVGECNDGVLNDITQRVIGREEVFAAIDAAGEEFAEGCVGGGAGMICHELKGGVGTASRVVCLGDKRYTVGVLVQANHGQLQNLTLCGKRVGPDIQARLRQTPRPREEGSCIAVLATDLPVSSRQLRRIVRRCGVGLARCGSFWGHGSGDIFLGFTTAATLVADGGPPVFSIDVINEDKLDAAFEAAAEAAEEAVLNALAAAVPTTGYTGRVCHALREFLNAAGPVTGEPLDR